ncbi:SRPBCC family protein [Fulvivirga kasyanovii]|uniref:SRPBCC domain-containing protein n=1 Tax=Fulvivirga kasyanovii TaxID=396812 RepID=A0ABW9RNC5_9BACT|nr:SRPBCC domain-containing protein [Fulvivirga kasyanovii]MTI25486.1 SRPBCC domain-containing protein [Fulvivirga kasyanovii]
MENQWSKFRLRVNVKTDMAAAYKAWNTSEALESWFLRKAVFKDAEGNLKDKKAPIVEGDTYEWFWYGYPDSVVEKGKVLKANGKNVFSFTFSLECPVTITIYEEAGETIVELVESDLPTDTETALKYFVGDSRGWIFYMANLKSILEGGLDLRNKRMELTNVITS